VCFYDVALECRRVHVMGLLSDGVLQLLLQILLLISAFSHDTVVGMLIDADWDVAAGTGGVGVAVGILRFRCVVCVSIS